MIVTRRGRRVRFHLAQDGRVLELSVEGYLRRRRGGYYVLADAVLYTRVAEPDGSSHVVETVMVGEYEVPARLVIGREVR